MTGRWSVCLGQSLLQPPFYSSFADTRWGYSENICFYRAARWQVSDRDRDGDSHVNTKSRLHVRCHFVLYLETWHQRLSIHGLQKQTAFVWEYPSMTFCLQTQLGTCHDPKVFFLSTPKSSLSAVGRVEGNNSSTAEHHKGLRWYQCIAKGYTNKAYQEVQPEILHFIVL